MCTIFKIGRHDEALMWQHFIEIHLLFEIASSVETLHLVSSVSNDGASPLCTSCMHGCLSHESVDSSLWIHHNLRNQQNAILLPSVTWWILQKYNSTGNSLSLRVVKTFKKQWRENTSLFARIVLTDAIEGAAWSFYPWRQNRQCSDEVGEDHQTFQFHLEHWMIMLSYLLPYDRALAWEPRMRRKKNSGFKKLDI